MTSVRLSPDGRELSSLVDSLASDAGRFVLGIAGEPGAGKSTLAAAVVRALGSRGVVVPLDGFHLADVQLAQQDLLHRKGAPETFDAWGYAALLTRLREPTDHVVYAPAFERDLEQPLAGAIAVPPGAEVVVTEGNYLLLDTAPWRAARATMDAVWFVRTDPGVRTSRLCARHVEFGKTPDEAARWVATVDEPNAALVEAGSVPADLHVDLIDWSPRLSGYDA